MVRLDRQATDPMNSAARIRVNGTVQGVGFRPFVYVTARSLALSGFVLNDGEGVEIVLEGNLAAIDRFCQRLKTELPPLASITLLERQAITPAGYTDFTIAQSQSGQVSTLIPADAAVCPDCLKELFDENNRRYRYPFINCTHCGPRFTITSKIPYDRPQTSMRLFPMCQACQSEYQTPLDRRFHAQPNACAHCGPDVLLVDAAGQTIPGDPFTELLARLKAGEIAAVKGLGGFHLVCDALNDQAVSKLRERKRRPSKPFALMAANLESVELYGELSHSAKKLLTSAASPIVLLPKKDKALPESIAPGLADVGFMLPTTPVQWLLFFEAAGRPAQSDWLHRPLKAIYVMTSANLAGDALVIDDNKALTELSGIADCFLLNNREILTRCDDSVVADRNGSPVLIRRSRGYVPQAITLASDGPAVLATGAWLKNTACLIRGKQAVLSQHIGDLDRPSCCRALKAAVDHLRDLLQATPAVVACDLHPDFYSTRLAEELAQTLDIPLVPVQHHHAHITSVMAEHHLQEEVVGIALDGVGLGDDGSSWGGEILHVKPDGSYERAAHLKPLPMPSGDLCARQGWRMACAVLAQQGGKLLERWPQKASLAITQSVKIGSRMPLSSSCGRLIDAAASVLGVTDFSSYEGEAAALLEARALNNAGQDLRQWVHTEHGVIDFTPLLLTLPTRADQQQACADFLETLAAAIATEAIRVAHAHGIGAVCLGGGCFVNRILSKAIKERLSLARLRVYEAQQVPCGDGGIALGQAWVARAHHRRTTCV